VDDTRLAAAVSPAEVEAFSEEDFEKFPQLAKGYIGPAGLKAAGVRYLLDPEVVPGTAWLTGADTAGYHVINLVAGRDFQIDGHLDVAVLRDGDQAPDGSGPLSLARGIEMGHIFELGTKYAEALGLKVLDADGKLQTVTMGSYGIGVSRAVAVVAEATCDDKGLCWPRSLAPFDVMVLATGKGDEIAEAAEKLAADLDASGVSVLLDDRKASPGVKFKDSEILGTP
ncbi:MAG: proline--tRNA ligase, partial [Propionibacteriaceae bacterium]|nr:proline--tRNA ligase [Propionibacteriaceae bacterium]